MYRHYLVSRTGKRVGHPLYWMDVPSWLDFAEADALSGPRLPVWDEYWTHGGILASFAEGVTACYMWLHQITLSGEQLLVTVETILAACQEAVQ